MYVDIGFGSWAGQLARYVHRNDQPMSTLRHAAVHDSDIFSAYNEHLEALFFWLYIGYDQLLAAFYITGFPWSQRSVNADSIH